MNSTLKDRPSFSDELDSPPATGSQPGSSVNDDDEASSKSMSPSDISEAESSATTGAGGHSKEGAAVNALDSKDDDIPYSEEDGRFANLRKKLGNDGVLGAVKKNKAASAGGGMLALLLSLFFISSLGSFKVIHFGEVLSASGYSRVRGISQERMTQNIFDVSVIEGEGTATLRGRTLVDRFLFRNLDNQLAELGRSKAFSFEYVEGKMTGVTIKGESINMNAITKELGYGENFRDLQGIKNKFSPQKIAQRAKVRAEFTQRIQTSVGQSFELEGRAVRGRVMSTISKNIGFDFNRWKQAGRKRIGERAKTSAIEDAVAQAEENNKITEIENVSAETKENIKKTKARETLMKHLEKTGGTFDEKLFSASFEESVGKSAKVQEAAGNVGTFVLVASLACIANDAARNVDEIQKNNEISAEKTAADMQGARSQTQAGKVTQSALQGTAKRYERMEKSAAYQRDVGMPVTSDTAAPNLKPDFNPNLLAIIKTLTSPSTIATGPLGAAVRAAGQGEVLDEADKAFCSALLSPTGAVVGVGVEIVFQAVVATFTAGGGTFASEGAAKAFTTLFVKELGNALKGTVRGLATREGATKTAATVGAFGLFSLGMNYVVQMLAGTGYSAAQSNENLYENGRVGTNLLQSRRERGQYARPVATSDAVKTDNHYSALDKKQRQTESVFARYISPSNPYSLLGMASARVPATATGILDSAPSTIASFASTLNPFSSSSFVRIAFLNPGIAHAADGDDKFGEIQQWSYSEDELFKMRNNPSYSITENENYISEDVIAQKDEEIGKCFDPAITQAEAEKLPECSGENLAKDENFRYRLYKFDSQLAETAEENLRPTANPVGTAAAVPAGTTAANPGTCAVGSVAVPGQFDGYVAGAKKSLTLCAINDLPIQAIDGDGSESTPGTAHYIDGANGKALVSSVISEKAVAMVAKAKTDGTPLIAISSFRTNAHQSAACGTVTNGKCANGGYAVPGQSAHQSGEAIDFLDSNRNRTANCRNSMQGSRCVGTDAVWKWLSTNAESFGFKQLPSESWHWSTSGT